MIPVWLHNDFGMIAQLFLPDCPIYLKIIFYVFVELHNLRNQIVL